MKSFINFSVITLVAVIISGTIYQCTSSPRNKETSQTEFTVEQQNMAKELSDLRNDIDRDLEKASKKVQNASAVADDQIERTYQVLVKKKQEVESVLTSVNQSTKENWWKVRKTATSTLEDVKRFQHKLEKNSLAQSN